MGCKLERDTHPVLIDAANRCESHTASETQTRPSKSASLPPRESSRQSSLDRASQYRDKRRSATRRASIERNSRQRLPCARTRRPQLLYTRPCTTESGTRARADPECLSHYDTGKPESLCRL